MDFKFTCGIYFFTQLPSDNCSYYVGTWKYLSFFGNFKHFTTFFGEFIAKITKKVYNKFS